MTIKALNMNGKYENLKEKTAFSYYTSSVSLKIIKWQLNNILYVLFMFQIVFPNINEF